MRKSKLFNIATSLLALACVSSSCQRVLPPNTQGNETPAPVESSNEEKPESESTPSLSLNENDSKASNSSKSDDTDVSASNSENESDHNTTTSSKLSDTENLYTKGTTKTESSLENTLSTKKLTPSEIKKHKNSENDSYSERLLNSILGLDKDKNKDKVGSIHKPHKIGETAYFDGSETLFDPFKSEVKIQEIYRGKSALKMIKDASIFNPEPEDEKEYLIAQVLVKVTASKNQEVVGLSPYYFSLANGNDGRMYGDVTLIRNITPVLSPIEEGETSIAYICFSVDKDDHNPYIVFLSRANGGIWFQTTEDTIEETAPFSGK